MEKRLRPYTIALGTTAAPKPDAQYLKPVAREQQGEGLRESCIST
jgi:hypothetical protein